MSEVAKVKGFNILIVKDEEALKKYVGILGLGVVANLADTLSSLTMGTGALQAKTIEDEMKATQSATEYFADLGKNGDDTTFYLIPADADVWTNPAPFDVFVAAMLAVNAPTSLRYIANSILVCTEKTHLVRDVNDRWATLLKAGSVEGNHDLPVRTNDAMTLALAYMTKSFVIGDVKKDDVFVIVDVGFRARQDFNIWAAWNAFGLNKEITGQDSDISEWLENNNLAHTFAKADDGAPTPEADAQNQAYQDAVNEWNNYSVEKRQNLSFRVDDRLATVAQLLDIAKLLPCAQLNHKQVMTLASALDDAFEQSDNSEVTLRQIILGTPLAPKEAPDFMNELLNLVNTYRAEAQDAVNIARQGYAICPFMQQEDKHAHAYSYGGSESEASVDAFCVMGNMDPVTMARLMEFFLIQMKETEGFDPYAITDAGGAKMGNGQPIRLRAINADADAAHAAGYYPAPTPTLHLLQVLIPDANNVLPGEEGYDAETYPQPMFPLPEKEATTEVMEAPVE